MLTKVVTVVLFIFPLFPDWQVKGILLCVLWELRGCKSSQGAMYRHGDWWPKDPCGFLYYPACSYTHPWNLHGEAHLVCNWFKVLGMCRGQPYQLLNVSTVTFVHYILHHNGRECCRFLNTDRQFKTFSHVWCKINSIPKFLHVINIHFGPSNVFCHPFGVGTLCPGLGSIIWAAVDVHANTKLVLSLAYM